MTGIPAPLDVHSLLSEQDFVRRLARSLVFEQDTVEDVVQEAWLAAAKNPPRQEASTRAWFARVIENLARRRARDRVRRQARERRAAAAESLPAVDAVLAREEQRQRVVAAVVALPEPYRGVVLARYFDGDEPAEIARQRGVPAATIRSQLKRALDLLRKKLDAEHGGDRRAWCLLLAPLARPEPATGLLSSFLAMAGAWIVVKIVGVACVLGLLVWGLLSIGGGGGAEAEAPVEARKEVAAGASGQDQEPLPRTRVAEATAAASAPSSAVAAAAAKADAGFRGRLLRQNGAPAAGEAVRFVGVEGLSLFADAGKDGVKIARGTATTAADGTFTVTGLVPNAFYAATLADGGNDQTLRMVPVAPGPDEVADLGDLRLVEKAAVTGRVVDPEGAPVAGAEVLCLDLPAAIGSLLPFARLAPEHGGFVTMPVPEPAELAGGNAWGQRLRRYLGATLFQDEGLEKRPGLATLLVDSLPWLQTIWDTLPIAKARTAADGTFRVAAAQPGSCWLVARKPGLAPGGKPRIVLRAGETKQVGDVALSRGEELAGRVLDAAGRPVTGAEVRVGVIAALGYRGAAFAEAPIHADAQGKFRVTGLGQERVLVAARSTRQGRWHVLGPVDVQGDLEVRLPATTTLEVSICSRDGKPLPDARPRLFVGPSLHELRRAGVQQELPLEGRMNALADGRLAIGDLGPGVYTLRVEEPGTVMAEAMVVLPAQEPLAIRLEPCSPLRVVVRDPDGRPLPGASVYLQQADEDGNDHAIMPTDYGLPRWSVVPHRAGETDSSGVLEARQRPAKAVVVHAFHPRFGVANALADERTTELVLALQRPGEIRGRLFDQGRPADPKKWAVSLRVASLSDLRSVPLERERVPLRADGTFVIGGLVPAKWEVLGVRIDDEPVSLHGVVETMKDKVYSLSFFSREKGTRRQVELAAGACVSVEFDVDPNAPEIGAAPARLRGVFTVEGRPRAGASISRDSFQHGRIDLGKTTEDGTFEARLPAGRHTIGLYAMEGEHWEGTVEVAAGAEQFLDLRIQGGSLAGEAAFATGLSPADHVVTATGALAGGELRRWAKIDAAGRFAFETLPVGSCTLVASGPDGKSKKVETRVEPGPNRLAERIVMQEHTVLRGTIEGTAEKYPWVQVRSAKGWTFQRGLEDGRFAFNELEPGIYEIEVGVGGKKFAATPKTVDLTKGSVRDLVLRVSD